MKRLLSAILWISTVFSAPAQTPEFLHPSRFGLNLARVILKDGTMHSGWFVGTIRDSVVVQVGQKSERHCLSNLARVTVETKVDKSPAALVGFIMGIYLGDFLALRAENQYAAFARRYESPVSYAAYSALFGLVGGGVGYLGAGTGTRDEVFDFTGTAEQIAAAWIRLADGPAEEMRDKRVHIAVYAGYVNAPFAPRGAYYPYGECTSWNLLRRLQVTCSVAEYAEVGIARMWLGQPRQTSYGYYLDGGVTGLRFDGYGYFLVGAVEPLHSLGWRSVRWNIGGGVGRASFEFEAQTIAYASYSASSSETRVADRTNGVAGLLYTDLNVSLTRGFSIGVWADMVMTNAGPPDLSDLQINGSKYTTSCAGVSVAFHL